MVNLNLITPELPLSSQERGLGGEFRSLQSADRTVLLCHSPNSSPRPPSLGKRRGSYRTRNLIPLAIKLPPPRGHALGGRKRCYLPLPEAGKAWNRLRHFSLRPGSLDRPAIPAAHLRAEKCSGRHPETQIVVVIVRVVVVAISAAQVYRVVAETPTAPGAPASRTPPPATGR